MKTDEKSCSKENEQNLKKQLKQKAEAEVLLDAEAEVIEGGENSNFKEDELEHPSGICSIISCQSNT